ncbi:MAG: carboxypeptidase regulatory-like domain-containing protein [Gemmataceae bacterium]
MRWTTRKLALSVWVLFALGSFLLTGCGSGDVAPVYGTVTFEGQPLKQVTVEFYPVEGGRPGTATTDENGYYDLKYLRDTRGAKVGKNKVKIYYTVEEDDDGKTIKPPVVIPPKYNTQTELIYDVPSGGGRIDIPLTP